MNKTFSDIEQYNNRMTISQVTRFFSKKGITVSKAMIQNYVREKLLPPPVDNRYYTSGHLTILALTDLLKNVFGIIEIKNAIKNILNENGIDLEVYRQLILETEEIMINWQKNFHIEQNGILQQMLICSEIKRNLLKHGV